MLLVIDIGNTNLALGLFQEDQLKHSWRVATRKEQMPDEYAVLFRNLLEVERLSTSDVEAIVICSVVPPLNECFEHMSHKYFGVNSIFVEPAIQQIMPIRYHPASDVGADRIVNAVAAYQMYGGPAIVVDLGTATTFDAISQKGEYLGGIIAPGIGISAEALFLQAARLPRVEIRKPPLTIGNSTVTSVQSGLYFGYVSLVEGVLRRMRKEMDTPHVTATGGLARLICEESEGIDRVEENLTLYGLRMFYERTQ